VNEEVILAPEQDDVAAADVFNAGLANQRDVLRPHPRKHACALHAQSNAATTLEGFRNAHGVAGAAFAADARCYFSPIGT
jgi:hypothetical protein